MFFFLKEEAGIGLVWGRGLERCAFPMGGVPRASTGGGTAIDPAVPATLAYVPFRIGAFYLTPPFWRWGTLPDFVPFVEISAILSWASLPAVRLGLWRLGRQPPGYYLCVPVIVRTAVISF